MCRAVFQRCRNYACYGLTQLLELILCENRPFCEIQVIRVSRNLNPHCLVCRATTRQEREKSMKRESTRAAAARKKAERAEMLNSQANGTKDSAHTRVKQQAESSITANDKGTVRGGFVPNSDNLSLISDENSSMGLDLLDQRRTELAVFDPPTNIFIDPTLIDIIDTIFSAAEDPMWIMQDATL